MVLILTIVVFFTYEIHVYPLREGKLPFCIEPVYLSSTFHPLASPNPITCTRGNKISPWQLNLPWSILKHQLLYCTKISHQQLMEHHHDGLGRCLITKTGRRKQVIQLCWCMIELWISSPLYPAMIQLLPLVLCCQIEQVACIDSQTLMPCTPEM